MFFAVALRAAMAVSVAMFQSRPVSTHYWNTTISFGEAAAANGTTLLREELLWAQQSINCPVGEPAIAGSTGVTATTTTSTPKCQDGEPSIPMGDSTTSSPPTMTAMTTFWRALLDDKDLNAATSIREAILRLHSILLSSIQPNEQQRPPFPPPPTRTTQYPKQHWILTTNLIDTLIDPGYNNNNERALWAFADPCDLDQYHWGHPYGLWADRFFRSRHAPPRKQ
jgi:hypothetical protein